MSNFVVIGTSHSLEQNGSEKSVYVLTAQNEKTKAENNRKVTQHYVDWENDDRWSEYLSKKLGYTNYYNRAIGSAGISTYPLRVISAVDELKPDFLLLEIPSVQRWAFPFEVDEGDTKKILPFDDHTWNQVHEDEKLSVMKYFQYLYPFNPGDLDWDPSGFHKWKNLTMSNKPINMAKEHIGMYAFINEKYIQYDLIAQVSMIDGYLTSKNIDYAWINYNSVIDKNIDKSLIGRYTKRCINEIIEYETILNYAKKNYEPDPEVGYCADGVHLNSNYWRKIVDDICVPYFESKKNGIQFKENIKEK